jgi:hypothetical protein
MLKMKCCGISLHVCMWVHESRVSVALVQHVLWGKDNRHVNSLTHNTSA